jgi:hypothetical protein
MREAARAAFTPPLSLHGAKATKAPTGFSGHVGPDRWKCAEGVPLANEFANVFYNRINRVRLLEELGILRH